MPQGKMNPIRFKKMVLNCKTKPYVLHFDPMVNFYHGKISSGKSTILRLFDFCFGGNLVKTRAISEELVSVELYLEIGEDDVVLERYTANSSHVRVTWQGSQERGSVSALAKGVSSTPIWGDEIYNLSDLMLYLLGVKPIRVKKGQMSDRSKLVRLSYRDMLKFCYLKQDELTSTFFDLDTPVLLLKSRYVMKFLLGEYTEKISELEIKLDEAKKSRIEKSGAAKEIHKFLSQFNYSSDSIIQKEIDNANQRLIELSRAIDTERNEISSTIHPLDEMRNRLSELSSTLHDEETALNDIQRKLSTEENLKAELIAAKVRHARGFAAREVLSGVYFERCPSCGLSLSPQGYHDRNICYLCGQNIEEKSAFSSDFELIQKDFNTRIDDLSYDIRLRKESLKEQSDLLERIRKEKARLDIDLVKESEHYDSILVARTRELEREIGKLRERISNLENILRMIRVVTNLENEVSDLGSTIDKLQREIEKEQEDMREIKILVDEICGQYIHALKQVKVPGVFDEDIVKLDRVTWIPSILHEGDPSKSWDYFDAGSAGKKTLLKICYALSLHVVASRNNLPLPSFLIIDSPMDHIDKEVNKEIFVGFYKYLYKLVENELSNTQIFLVDQEYVSEEEFELTINQRRMTLDDPEFPPLFEDYKGP